MIHTINSDCEHVICARTLLRTYAILINLGCSIRHAALQKYVPNVCAYMDMPRWGSNFQTNETTSGYSSRRRRRW